MTNISFVTNGNTYWWFSELRGECKGQPRSQGTLGTSLGKGAWPGCGQSIPARAGKFNWVAATQEAHSMCNDPVQRFVMHVISIHIFQYFFDLSPFSCDSFQKTFVSKDKRDWVCLLVEGRGSRVTSRGSRVNGRGSRVTSRGSRVNGRESKNPPQLFPNFFSI